METSRNELKIKIGDLSNQVSFAADCFCELLAKCEIGSRDYDKILSYLLNFNKFFAFLSYVEDEFTKEVPTL